jgi:hypothetical protein
MQKKRIEKAIDVINYAIKNGISVKAASLMNGFSDTYIKNTKSCIIEEYSNNTMGDEEYDQFMSKYNEYLEKKFAKVELFDVGTSNPEEIKGLTSIYKKSDNYHLEKLKKALSESNLMTDFASNTKFTQSDKTGELEWIGKSNYPVDHIKTLDELLIATKVDTDVWKVKDFTVNKWDVTSTRNGSPQTIQNFQVKARLEKIIEILRFKQAAEIFKEMVRNYKPPVISEYTRENIVGDINEETNLLEISIFDLHMGKLAWAGETGENYDTKIATQRFMETIQTLLQRAAGFNYDRILFPIGNDFFNSDTIANTTTAGTPQDEDLRWQKTFKVGSRLIVDAINLLKQSGVIVDVIVIPGNHDFERTFYLGEFLDAFFHNDKQVNINNSASPRKYYQFGEVLLGFTHGNEEKESSLPLIMANDIESKPLWSKTTYHEWHLGHVHRKRNVKYAVVDRKMMINEDLGVTVRYLSSLTGTEEWHHKKGYIGAIKAADAFIWNNKLGLVAHINSNLIVR